MRHFITRSMFTELPALSEINAHIDIAVQDSHPMHTLPNGGFAIATGDQIASVKSIMDTVKREYELEFPEAHLYISASANSDTFGRHCDAMDVYIVQGYGETEYIIEEELNHTYVLSKGDMLYIPAGIYHTPKPLCQRFVISIG